MSPSPRSQGAEKAASSWDSVDLYWIPLGAGGHFVHFNGKAYEALMAHREGRRRQDLYHSALEIRVPEGRSVIEMAWPIPKGSATERGAVAQGPVGWKWAGRFRVSRYEIRCWRDGRIPDIGYAVDSPVRVSNDAEAARRILALAPLVPSLVWGRDQLGVGDMWNSNSCISWLLERSGITTSGLRPPRDGRAPGWDAGLFAARLAATQGAPAYSFPHSPVIIDADSRETASPVAR